MLQRDIRYLVYQIGKYRSVISRMVNRAFLAVYRPFQRALICKLYFAIGVQDDIITFAVRNKVFFRICYDSVTIFVIFAVIGCKYVCIFR